MSSSHQDHGRRHHREDDHRERRKKSSSRNGHSGDGRQVTPPPLIVFNKINRKVHPRPMSRTGMATLVMGDRSVRLSAPPGFLTLNCRPMTRAERGPSPSSIQTTTRKHHKNRNSNQHTSLDTWRLENSIFIIFLQFILCILFYFTFYWFYPLLSQRDKQTVLI